MPSHKARRERLNRWLWALLDVAIWPSSIFAAAWLRFELEVAPVLTAATLVSALVAAATHLTVGALWGPYAVGHERASFAESRDVSRTVAITGMVLTVVAFQPHFIYEVPRSVPFTATAFAMVAMFASRFIIRSWRTRHYEAGGNQKKVLIFGAGEAGTQLTRSLIRDATSEFHPVAILDDDPAKARLWVEGVKVRGNRHHMAAAGYKYHAETIIIALPRAEASTIRELTALAADAGLDVMVLPPISEIIGGRVSAGDLRGVNVADLLGRRPIDLDMATIAEQIADRRVMVTGAGGSIGSELCRQIARFGPAKLFLLDRDESGLQATQLTLAGHGLLDSDEVILNDIRDADAVSAVFESARPDIVFHAAALKHLPLLEAYPLEAWKSNVLGTRNVLTSAARVGVTTFVNISTDKAADPTSVLGYTKRVAERLTADFARRAPGRYVSVRFGNVLGSRGSVVHAFSSQIAGDGPITVTHPDVSRYFMLIPEACQLVLQASSIGNDGEVMVLDMGDQVKILEVARTLIRISGRTDVDIVYTGLRAGEKLTEKLFSNVETPHPTSHPLVSRVAVPPVDLDIVNELAFSRPQQAVEWMRETCAPTHPTAVPVNPAALFHRA